MMIEEIIAERLHEKGLGIYDENGCDGNIYLVQLPDESGNKADEIISILTSGSNIREPSYHDGVVKPISNIYVRGKNLHKVAKKAHEIANTINNDSYKSKDFEVLQTFISAEPILLRIDEKGFYMYSMRISQNINFK